MKILPAAILTALIFTGKATAANNPLPNPGFEDGITGWSIKDQMSHAVSEATHEGALGLHIADEDPANGSSVMSSRLPVEPEQTVELSFWARTKTDFASVYLWFYDAKGKTVKDPTIKGDGLPQCPIKKIDGEWNRYTLAAKAPAEAASVAIWIHSFSTAKGVLDLDDFALSGIDEGATPIIAKTEVPPPVPTTMPPRAKPPVIIIKVDDLRQVNGQVPGMWKRVADFIKDRKIKASIGIICTTLAEATPEYAQWIKDQQASGRIEFWFHGWTHDVRTENGKAFGEFVGRPYEDQKQRFDQSQKVAIEKLGFPFRTFGPPGGAAPSFDATTVQVMADDPHMNVWLYPTPLDAAGQKLEAAGKVLILDRVWDVNLERTVGVPDYNRLVIGFAKHPDREYFVLQGHPMQWGAPGRFEEFTKMIDFLIAQKAVFMTPSEYAAERRAAALKP